MSSSHVDDVVEVGIGRLPFEFRDDKPDFVAFLTALLKEIQVSEDVTFDLIELRQLDTASGANLEQYGELVDERVDGLPTADIYRNVLRVKILSNASEGQAETLISIIAGLTESEDVRVLDVYPAGIIINFTLNPPLSAFQRSRLVRFIRRSKSAGVRLDGVVEAGVGYFGFSTDPDASGFDLGRFGSLID